MCKPQILVSDMVQDPHTWKNNISEKTQTCNANKRLIFLFAEYPSMPDGEYTNNVQQAVANTISGKIIFHYLNKGLTEET